MFESVISSANHLAWCGVTRVSDSAAGLTAVLQALKFRGRRGYVRAAFLIRSHFLAPFRPNSKPTPNVNVFLRSTSSQALFQHVYGHGAKAGNEAANCAVVLGANVLISDPNTLWRCR